MKPIAAFGQLRAAGDRLPVVGVAAVDDQVAGGQQLAELGDGGPGRFARPGP